MAALLAPWNPSIDQLQLPEGYMSITLLDTFALSYTSVLGNSLPLEYDDALLEQVQAHIQPFKSNKGQEKTKTLSYSGLEPKDVSKVLPDDAALDLSELIDFFWYFLCQYIFSITSKKQVESLLPWAVTLANWCYEGHDNSCAFAQVILAAFYNGLSCLSGKSLPISASIPY